MTDSATRPTAAGIRLTWLGQAGFCFTTDDGKQVYLDPYLSNACERLFGFKRLSLPAVCAENVEADWVIFTHEHADHLDPDAIPLIARNNPGCRFAGPAGCTEGLEAAGVPAARRVLLEPNARHDLGDLIVHTAPADHGDISPTALALVLDFGDVRVMATGDSSWRPVLFKPLYDLDPDVVLPAINGVFGNMNHIDAARLVSEVKPRLAIPCHFWTLAEQGGGDPAGFVHACAVMCPQVKALLLRPGEELSIKPDSDT
ncbi:MAG: MBL fold metallo-hydrolase [Lentisphaerae bacterium]|nr:MBL fold metallo-hydrolase [Lentisphaerota bacterium]